MTTYCRLILILIVSLLLAPARAGSSEAAPLRIGVTPVYPPIIYKEAGKLVGVEIDFANALSEELGRPIKFVEIDWEDQVPDLIAGKTDLIMSSMSITKARSLRVAFTTPYLGVGQIILVRRGDAGVFASGFPTALSGTIGVLKGTTGDFLVEQEFPRNKRVTFKTPQDAAKALQKKKIDLFVSDSPVVLWLSAMNELEGLIAVPTYLTQEQLAWATRRSDPQLLEAIDRALEKMQKDGRANAIIKRWIPAFK